MRVSGKFMWILSLALLGLLVLVTAVSAQQQQQPQGGNAQLPGFAGRPGMARDNMVFGTISEVDAANKSFAVKTREGEVWVTVADNVQIRRIAKAAAADLQLGMNVVVRGRPTTITAVTVGVGEELPVAPQRPQRPQGGGVAPAAGAAGPVPNANADGAAPANPGGFPAQEANAQRGALAVLGGKITKLEPLTVTTADGNDILINLPAEATLTVTTDVTLADLKAEEGVLVVGQRNADGTYAARMVRVGEPGLQLRGLGFGGGPGLRGGQAGAGFPGRQGRQPRGNRGGAAGAPQAAPGAAPAGPAAAPAVPAPHGETEV